MVKAKTSVFPPTAMTDLVPRKTERGVCHIVGQTISFVSTYIQAISLIYKVPGFLRRHKR